MITWLHEVTWLIKNDISPLPRGPWLPNLTRWNFIVKGHYLLSLLTLWSCNQVITWHMKNDISQLPRDLRPPHLSEWWILMRAYYPSSHSTCWSRGHISHMTNEKCFKFLFTWPVAIELGRKGSLWLGVTCSTQSHIFLRSRGYVSSRDKLTSLYLYFQEAYCN